MQNDKFILKRNKFRRKLNGMFRHICIIKNKQDYFKENDYTIVSI